MSMPNKLMMPGDNAPNPFAVAGTSRKYSCAAGAAVLVPEADAAIMMSAGWVNATGPCGFSSAGPTTARPTSPYVGHTHTDTTISAVVVYAGKVTGWLNSATGASA